MENKKGGTPLIVKVFDPKMAFYDFVKYTGAVSVLVDLRLKRIFEQGKKPKGFARGRYIVCSNHMSTIDPILLMNVFWNRRITFVATMDLFEKRFWNFFFNAVGCIPIDKKNPSVETFKQVAERLDRGHLVCVFPEGEVSLTDSLGSFKTGAVMMAVIAGAPLQPVYLAKRKNILHRQVAVLGERIDPADHMSGPFPTMEEMTAMTELLAEKERGLEALYRQVMKVDDR